MMSTQSNTSITAANVNLYDLPCTRHGNLCTFTPVITKDSRGRTRQWNICVYMYLLADDNKAQGVSPTITDSAGNTLIPADIRDEYYNNAPIPGAVVHIITSSFLEDGKTVESIPTEIRMGSNLGKKNQTNAFTQALRDAYGLYMKYKKSHTRVADTPSMLAPGDEGQSTSTPPNVPSSLSPGVSSFIPPMLLNKYARLKPLEDASPDSTTPAYEMKIEKGTVKINFAAETIYIQPKIDDIRGIAILGKDGEIILYSRRLTAISGFTRIRAALSEMFSAAARLGIDTKGLHFDGGFYAHGMSLQDISSIVRNVGDRSREDLLQFTMFDCFRETALNEPFSSRWNTLERIFSSVAGASSQLPIALLPTSIVRTHEEVISTFDQYISQGYEGAILRRATGTYLPGYNNSRSKDVLKIKLRSDAEYRIVGYTEGIRGKDKGAIVWILTTEDGRHFNVVPNMTLEDRYTLFSRLRNNPQDFEKFFKDKMMTIEYDDLSKDDVPLRAKALRIREEP